MTKLKKRWKEKAEDQKEYGGIKKSPSSASGSLIYSFL
jgi:hypothetical protein